MDKNEEIRFAEFFTEWLNETCNADYRTIPNNNENKIDKEIDVYAKSESGLQQLNFQVVTSEGILRREEGRLRSISKKTGNNVVTGKLIDLDKEWIKKAIKDKEKKYSAEVKKSLILLIQKEIGPLFNENYFKKHFEKFKNSDFKGIYLMHLPLFKENSSHPHNGQILKIKEVEFHVKTDL